MGIYGELIAKTMNSNCIYGDHGAIHIETQVLDWMKQMFALPKNSSAVLVSGGSMANLYGLAVARNSQYKQARKNGLGNQQLIIYCSTETHNSVDKAIELLGIGSDFIRKIPVKADFAIDLNILQKTIKADFEKGYQPFCVVGNAGTVNTGAIDPLQQLAGNLCKGKFMVPC